MIWTRVWPKLGGSCLLVICYAAQCAAARACASCAVGSNSHRQFHFLIKMSFDNKAAQAAAAGSTVTPTTSPSTWAHPEMMLKRTAKRPSLETSIRHPTIVTIICPMWQLCAAMMSWVRRWVELDVYKNIQILFAEKSQILLKISVIPIL